MMTTVVIMFVWWFELTSFFVYLSFLSDFILLWFYTVLPLSQQATNETVIEAMAMTKCDEMLFPCKLSVLL